MAMSLATRLAIRNAGVRMTRVVTSTRCLVSRGSNRWRRASCSIRSRTTAARESPHDRTGPLVSEVWRAAVQVQLDAVDEADALPVVSCEAEVTVGVDD